MVPLGEMLKKSEEWLTLDPEKTTRSNGPTLGKASVFAGK